MEAIVPDQGQNGSPDRVPDSQTDYPEKQIILRYRAAIQEKHQKKYQGYISKKIVGDNDSFIVAINSAKVPVCWRNDPLIPTIIKAVYPVGPYQLQMDRRSRNIIGRGFQARYSIKKSSGKSVSTDIFLDPSYAGISGILFSHVDVTRAPNASKSDFVFIHNALAKNRVREGFFNFGAEYIAQDVDDSYNLTRIDHGG